MEDSYIIKGGNILKGYLQLSGAKNVALKIIIAVLMTDKEVILENVPRIKDVYELLHLIKLLGGKADFVDKNKVLIDGREINKNRVDLLHGSKVRVSFMMFAPLLYKFGTCFIPNPGGCRIGARPIDRIVEGIKTLGVDVEYSSATGYYQAKMKKRPVGYFKFNKSSHTGTELLILLAVLGAGAVTIDNAALEPEIDNLILFLNQSGAKIKREGIKIKIESVNQLKPPPSFSIIPDRNELVTFACLTIANNGRITTSPIPFSLIETFIKKLKKIGAGMEVKKNGSCIFYRKGGIRGTVIETSPHPGFMTDWQPPWAVMMTQAEGESIIYERVFENRFSYVEELKKIGADIDYLTKQVEKAEDYFFFKYDPQKTYRYAIRIKGSQKLHGGVLDIKDIRAGATLAIAALIAEGESVVNGASILDRGYEDFENKIKSLGGKIRRI